MSGLPGRVHDAYVAGEGILYASLLGLFSAVGMRGARDGGLDWGPRGGAISVHIGEGPGPLRDPGPPEGTTVELSRYLIVKYQDLAPTFPAASVATIFTVFLPLESLGEL
jgi:hypothetical protein